VREGICEDCVFFDPTEAEHGAGLCRRLSPAPGRRRDNDATWPRVLFIDWCGEFEPALPED
jgi:hypothetical protein